MNETARAVSYQANQETQATRRDGPTELTAICQSLFTILARLATQKELLDADQVMSAPDDNVIALLGAVRSLRRDCDDIASLIRMAQPATMLEAALKNDALLAHAIAEGADDFMSGNWPNLPVKPSDSPHATASSTYTFLLRSWIEAVQARHAS